MKHTLLIRSFALALLVSVGSVPALLAEDSAAPGLQSVAGAVIPGGAIISTAFVTLEPIAGGASISAPIESDGRFRVAGLTPGRYRLVVASTRIGKQTQGATFGEKVNQGLHAAGSALSQGTSAVDARHDTAKNSVGNIRAREVAPITPVHAPPAAAPAAKVDINGGMPNRISMNVTIAKTTLVLEVDGAGVEIEVEANGALSGQAFVR